MASLERVHTIDQIKRGDILDFGDKYFDRFVKRNSAELGLSTAEILKFLRQHVHKRTHLSINTNRIVAKEEQERTAVVSVVETHFQLLHLTVLIKQRKTI